MAPWLRALAAAAACAGRLWLSAEGARSSAVSAEDFPLRKLGVVGLAPLGSRQHSGAPRTLKLQQLNEFSESWAEVDYDLSTPAGKAGFERERYFADLFQSANFAECTGSSVSPDGIGSVFTEPYGGTLKDVVRSARFDKLWSPPKGLYVVAIDLLRAMVEMAGRECLHNAIGPENIFIIGDVEGADCQAKLGGFSRAGYVRGDKTPQIPSSFPASAYGAPELYMDLPLPPALMLSADVWSAGVTFVEAFAGSLPTGWELRALPDRWRRPDDAQRNHEVLLRHIHNKVEDERMRRLLTRMVQPYVEERVSAEDALRVLESIAWLNGVRSRPGAQQVQHLKQGEDFDEDPLEQ